MRRFLNPKALGLGLVGLVLIAAMGLLGRWQWSVYDNHQRQNAESELRQAPVPLDSVLGPDQAFPNDGVSRPVTVTGRYLADQQLYVESFAGAPERYAVVTPLVTPSGSAILVVRGASSTLGAPSPRVPVRVDGVLEPSADAGRPLDDRRVTGALAIPSLVSSITPDLYSGYVILRSSTPAQAPALTPIPPPLPNASRWSGIRNLLYACQWWVFAAFVAFMWWRITGDLATRDEPQREPATDSGSDPETDPLSTPG